MSTRISELSSYRRERPEQIQTAPTGAHPLRILLWKSRDTLVTRLDHAGHSFSQVVGIATAEADGHHQGLGTTVQPDRPHLAVGSALGTGFNAAGRGRPRVRGHWSRRPHLAQRRQRIDLVAITPSSR